MKVALLLTGLVGSLKGKSYDKKGGEDVVLNTCYEKTKEHLLDKNDVDVFFHTWDVDMKNDLVSKYSPVGYETQEQKIFTNIIPDSSNRVRAHYSKWYSIKKAMGLKREHEQLYNFKYDFVIQARFDLVWKTDVIFSDFDVDKFYIPGTSKGGQPWGWPHPMSNHEVGDLFFFSNSKNMDKFGDLYNDINPYLLNGCPTFNGISNHMLAKWHLRELKLLPNKTETALDDKTDFEICRKYLNDKQ